MNLLISVACVLGLFSVCTAHLCLLSPMQRGSMKGLNMAGSTDCVLTMAPCGGRPSMMPMTMWSPGSNYTVTFQKNLDHWAKSTPGYFAMTMMANGMSQELGRVADMGEPSLHIYEAMVMLPENMAPMTYMLQVTYVTRNSMAPAVFYQCADVMVK